MNVYGYDQYVAPDVGTDNDLEKYLGRRTDRIRNNKLDERLLYNERLESEIQKRINNDKKAKILQVATAVVPAPLEPSMEPSIESMTDSGISIKITPYNGLLFLILILTIICFMQMSVVRMQNDSIKKMTDSLSQFISTNKS